jgi:hypothetical protein
MGGKAKPGSRRGGIVECAGVVCEFGWSCEARLPVTFEEEIRMSSTSHHDERIAGMTFASVYPLYVAKVEKKGRSKEELHQVLAWLTGYSDSSLQKQIDMQVTFEEFFRQAKINPNAALITGVICGYRVEEIENPLTQQVRYLDKLVDELAKGRKMNKILRE